MQGVGGAPGSTCKGPGAGGGGRPQCARPKCEGPSSSSTTVTQSMLPNGWVNTGSPKATAHFKPCPPPPTTGKAVFS